MRSTILAIALGAGWSSHVSAQEPPPPYPDVSVSVSLHPGSVPVLPDADYHTWVVEDGVGFSEFSADGLNFRLAAQGLDPNEAYSKLIGDANDAVYTTPFASYGQRLVGSGITTEQIGGSLKLTVSGLPDGQYWLTSWFNRWDNADPIRGAAVHMTLNGLGKSYLPWQTSQAETIFEASANVFDIRGGTAEISYRPYLRPGNIYMTGFAINGINPWAEIVYPSPASREDVPAPDGEVLASWSIPRDTLPGEFGIYNIYFGSSPDELERVAFEQTELEYLFTGLESGSTYYWRVDTRLDWEAQFQNGRTLQFTVV